MTQDSWMHNCGAGDGRSITDSDWHRGRSVLQTFDKSKDGVIKTAHPDYLNWLEPTNPSGNILRIKSGFGVVAGVEFRSNNDFDFDVTGPGLGAQTDIIVMQYDITNFLGAESTVRLAHKTGTPGGAAAVVQQDSNVWEVLIATLTINGATGALTSFVDNREFVDPPLKIFRQGGSATDFVIGGTNLYLPGQLRMELGATTWTGAAATSGFVQVLFAKPFTNNPVIFVNVLESFIGAPGSGTPVSWTTENIAGIGVYNTGFYINWLSSGGTFTSVPFVWQAIGAN